MSQPLSSGPKVLFAGGGSGGHLYPAVAVADWLRQFSGATCEFAGAGRPIELTILKATPYRQHVIPSVAGPELRSHPIRSSWSLLSGLWQANQLIKANVPDVVVGCGGYASLPTVLIAALRRIPIVLLEQNVTPGQATMLLAPLARAICLPTEEIRQLRRWRQKCVTTGNPVRAGIAGLRERPVEEVLNRRSILVMGGSQGSTAINTLVGRLFALIGIPAGWQVTHLTGTPDRERVRTDYAQAELDVEVLEYANNMSSLLGRSGIVICRAGAMTLAELNCAGLPALILPLPTSARDHQRANATWQVTHGAAELFDEHDPEVIQKLGTDLKRLTSDDVQRRLMIEASRGLARPEATRLVAQVIARLSRH